jgi:hypothetical protein
VALGALLVDGLLNRRCCLLGTTAAEKTVLLWGLLIHGFRGPCRLGFGVAGEERHVEMEVCGRRVA